MQAAKPNLIDEYIAGFPEEVQKLLQHIRKIVQEAAPEATEVIKYAMPTFVQNGNLIHFAAFQNHIGFYATPSGHQEFENELSKYKRGKGSVQFPLHEPIPFELIRKLVKYRVKMNS